jgi:hypothetical protein
MIEVIVNSGIGLHTTRFSLDSASDVLSPLHTTVCSRTNPALKSLHSLKDRV